MWFNKLKMMITARFIKPRIVLYAAVLALYMSLIPVAFAQALQQPQQVQPNQLRATELIGSTVYDAQNRNMGRVRDIVLDRDGKIAAVVIDIGAFLGMGGKNIAVKLSDLKSDKNRLTLSWSKEQLQQTPSFRLSNRETTAGSSAGK